jgi:hypothetical protein
MEGWESCWLPSWDSLGLNQLDILPGSRGREGAAIWRYLLRARHCARSSHVLSPVTPATLCSRHHQLTFTDEEIGLRVPEPAWCQLAGNRPRI